MICSTCNLETEGMSLCARAFMGAPCAIGLAERPKPINRAGEDYPYIAQRMKELEAERNAAFAKP